MRGDEKSAARVDEFGDFRKRARTAGGEELFFNRDDFIVPSDNGLVAEAVGVVLARRKRRINPLGEFQSLLDRIEKGGCMDFFGGLNLNTKKASDSCAPGAFGQRRGVACRLVVGQRNAVHSCFRSGGDNRRRTHF